MQRNVQFYFILQSNLVSINSNIFKVCNYIYIVFRIIRRLAGNTDCNTDIGDNLKISNLCKLPKAFTIKQYKIKNFQ